MTIDDEINKTYDVYQRFAFWLWLPITSNILENAFWKVRVVRTQNLFKLTFLRCIYSSALTTGLKICFWKATVHSCENRFGLWQQKTQGERCGKWTKMESQVIHHFHLNCVVFHFILLGVWFRICHNKISSTPTGLQYLQLSTTRYHTHTHARQNHIIAEQNHHKKVEKYTWLIAPSVFIVDAFGIRLRNTVTVSQSSMI